MRACVRCAQACAVFSVCICCAVCECMCVPMCRYSHLHRDCSVLVVGGRTVPPETQILGIIDS